MPQQGICLLKVLVLVSIMTKPTLLMCLLPRHHLIGRVSRTKSAVLAATGIGDVILLSSIDGLGGVEAPGGLAVQVVSEGLADWAVLEGLSVAA